MLSIQLEDAVQQMDTDYLVVGAGASAMAFTDALLASSDARVVLVDRRDRPGGHWLDAYPFVRLHQPSAYYGVPSRRLGNDRIDEVGINAGFYERASGAELCDYYSRVLDEDFVASGRVEFLPMCDYRGEDAEGHHVVSLLTGAETTIRASKLVDATYVQSEIPSRHTPPFTLDPGVRLVTPNDLVDLDEAPGGFTVLGAGKTAMDTCCWLLDAGVDPDRIQWVRPRESWLFDRATVQPLELVGTYMQLQARWIEAAAGASNGPDFAARLEAQEVFTRIDTSVEPQIFRGATISTREIAALRTIERVVRQGKVRNVGREHLTLTDGDVRSSPGQVYVDCTAAGVPAAEVRPVFAARRITLQYVMVGMTTSGAATIGVVEASRDDDGDKNRLCPPLTFTGDIADVLTLAHVAMVGAIARSAEPDLAAWTGNCRLNPAQAAATRSDDPEVAAAHVSTAANFGAAMQNLAGHARASVPGQAPRHGPVRPRNRHRPQGDGDSEVHGLGAGIQSVQFHHLASESTSQETR